MGMPVKSAYELLLTKVTKPRLTPDKKGCDLYAKNNKYNGWQRLRKSQ